MALARIPWTRAEVMGLGAPERVRVLKAARERLQAEVSSMQNVLAAFAGR